MQWTEQRFRSEGMAVASKRPLTGSRPDVPYLSATWDENPVVTCHGVHVRVRRQNRCMRAF